MVINWWKLTEFDKAKANVDAPWLMVLESFGDATHLKIEADGQWKARDSVLPDCGPDGLPGLVLPDDQLVVTKCRFCALIGKIGGSSAIHHVPDTPAAAPVADEPFAVGAVCLLKIPADTFGPLYIGFNAATRPMTVKQLKVTVHGARPTL